MGHKVNNPFVQNVANSSLKWSNWQSKGSLQSPGSFDTNVDKFGSDFPTFFSNFSFSVTFMLFYYFHLVL